MAGPTPDLFAETVDHDVIHGLDITEALGRATVSPPERIKLVLFSPRLPSFGTDLTGVRLIATDALVAVGDGADVPLPAKDILLVCTGRRPVPAPR